MSKKKTEYSDVLADVLNCKLDLQGKMVKVPKTPKQAKTEKKYLTELLDKKIISKSLYNQKNQEIDSLTLDKKTYLDFHEIITRQIQRGI